MHTRPSHSDARSGAASQQTSATAQSSNSQANTSPQAAIIVRQLSHQLSNGRALFNNLNLSLGFNCQALVGTNGTGKSLLAQLLAGKIAHQSGVIQRQCPVAYLPQTHSKAPRQVVANFLGVSEILNALNRIEAGNCDTKDFELADSNWLLKDQLFTALDKYDLPQNLALPVSELSGGQQTKLALLKLSLTQARFFILDEPSNHLDQANRRWLLHWIAQQLSDPADSPKGVLLISHDRQLLNHTSSIFELRAQQLFQYGGNYQHYAAQRKQEAESARSTLEREQTAARNTLKTLQKEKEKQQRKNQRGKKSRKTTNQSKALMDFAKERSAKTSKRITATHNARVASATEKLAQASSAVEKLENQYFDVAAPRIQHGELITIANVCHPYIQATTLNQSQGISLTIHAGERYALSGANATGKSTLLQILAKQISPRGGTISKSRGEVGLLDQHCKLLSAEHSVLDNIARLTRRNNNGLEPSEQRRILAQLRFSESQIQQPVKYLSGGERMKLAIACALGGCVSPDLLLLDEPDNHLDLDTLQVLEKTLQRYKGALIVVSHSPDFINAMGVNKTLVLGKQ